MSTIKDTIEKAKQYQAYAITKCNAHYKTAERYKTYNTRLGTTAVIFSTAVGTSIFGNLSENDPNLTIAFGIASFTAAALSALQTFLRYSEASEKHRLGAVGYEDLRRDLDVFIMRYENEEDKKAGEALDAFEELMPKFKDLSEKSPSIPDKVYDSVTHNPAKE